MSDPMAMYQDEATRRAFIGKAKAVYQQLQGTLEPAHNGEIVVIEPESGEHFLGKTLGQANNAAFAKFPDSWVYFVRIGEAEAAVPLKTW
ncbi:MAG: hypothetical protein FJZ89_06365 [Chloroflexi bacterium]|nr:hypothetical protein [Chloroflexota bacterium]